MPTINWKCYNDIVLFASQTTYLGVMPMKTKEDRGHLERRHHPRVKKLMRDTFHVQLY